MAAVPDLSAKNRGISVGTQAVGKTVISQKKGEPSR